MISSVFGKTKPVNYILVLAFLFLLYAIVLFFRFDREISLETLPMDVLGGVALLLSILLMNFIVQRNQLTGAHSFVIYFFALLVLLFPESLLDRQALVANLFVLLALRRLISLKSLRNVKSKIFDGTLWILVGSLLVDWVLLFLLLPWLYVYFYDPRSLRNWLNPLAAVVVVGLIATAILMLAGIPDFMTSHYRLRWEGTVEYWSQWRNAVKLSLYVMVILIAGFIAFLKLGKAGHGRIVVMRLLAISLLIGIAVVMLRSGTRGSPIVLTFFPAAVFLSKYIESVRKEKFREGLLIGSLVFGLVVFASEWAVR
ncbi:DUF6427 family protein [Robiginitalea sp. SC105]|uniref:DUF6427 family protein n=1 Tax=Robiginitalea sp. SC105 TaxID=2762332 RepID=UPI00163B4767|nr:DUF6427 family protein [Robiginitalea sp. SC105]MBC2838248.1 hypothetical protein [Robiginitalea sp. SC105]